MLLGSDADDDDDDGVQTDLHDFVGFSMPRTASAPIGRHPTPLGAKPAPRLPHASALGEPVERTGPGSEFGQREAVRGALPVMPLLCPRKRGGSVGREGFYSIFGGCSHPGSPLH